MEFLKKPLKVYKNDMFNGKGKFTDLMGKIIEGTFKNGKFLK
jgi:hypothetical protein